MMLEEEKVNGMQKMIELNKKLRDKKQKEIKRDKKN
jgi:hypothetical protein